MLNVNRLAETKFFFICAFTRVSLVLLFASVDSFLNWYFTFINSEYINTIKLHVTCLSYRRFSFVSVVIFTPSTKSLETNQLQDKMASIGKISLSLFFLSFLLIEKNSMFFYVIYVSISSTWSIYYYF